MNSDDAEPFDDLEATMEIARQQRSEDLTLAARLESAGTEPNGTNRTQRPTAAFLEQMKASPRPGAAPSTQRRWGRWAALGSLAAAAMAWAILRTPAEPQPSHDPRGPLMHAPASTGPHTVRLESVEQRTITVRLGAGFLSSGFYRAKALDGSGSLVASSLEESEDRWVFDVPGTGAMPETLVIAVESYFEGSSIPEESWSTTIDLSL